MNDIDHLVTVQCAAGKNWTQLQSRHTTHGNAVSDGSGPASWMVPSAKMQKNYQGMALMDPDKELELLTLKFQTSQSD